MLRREWSDPEVSCKMFRPLQVWDFGSLYGIVGQVSLCPTSLCTKTNNKKNTWKTNMTQWCYTRVCPGPGCTSPYQGDFFNLSVEIFSDSCILSYLISKTFTCEVWRYRSFFLAASLKIPNRSFKQLTYHKIWKSLLSNSLCLNIVQIIAHEIKSRFHLVLKYSSNVYLNC